MPIKRKFAGSYAARKRSRFSYPRYTKRYYKRSLRKKGYRTSTKVYSYMRYCSQFANVQRVNLPGTGAPDPWIPADSRFYIPAAVNATYEIDATFTPNFADIKNQSEFTNLYDRYMLTGVRYTFRLGNNPNSEHNLNSTGTTAIANNFYPEIWMAADYDDNNTITKSQIQEYQNVRRAVMQPNRPVSFFLKAPRTKAGVIDGSTIKAAGVGKPYQWIDMSQTTIDHFGLKIAICAPSPNRVLQFDFEVHVEARYYFKCKDVR